MAQPPLYFALVASLAGCCSGLASLRRSGVEEPQKPEVATSFCDSEGWTRDWADEFDNEELDPSSWLAIGHEDRDLDKDNVVSSLSVTACRTALCTPENVKVHDGALHIISERNGSGYTTGGVTTQGLRTWKDVPSYRLCVKAKLPGGTADDTGVWPAHWMLPDNGISDQCLDEGEMDIMEMLNGDGQIYNTYHYMTSWPEQKCADFDTYHNASSSVTPVSAWADEFHEFAVERSANHIAFVVDNVVQQNMSTQTINAELARTPFFLILNTAIGGGWPGEPTPSTQLPVKHVIDYVRVSRPDGEDGAGAGVQPSSFVPELLSEKVVTNMVHAAVLHAPRPKGLVALALHDAAHRHA
eukprot:TRINITY_DN75915_c0_g1_i1.p1 TRINITY_DN75915_c0_g1~~TRINITY_DN75915_c0_g1_i1.p1  ORF type:complete len:356 (-),score=51.99 TRINITY_DN75915_c0_g1_i1:123-1190(-)